MGYLSSTFMFSWISATSVGVKMENPPACTAAVEPLASPPARDPAACRPTGNAGARGRRHPPLQLDKGCTFFGAGGQEVHRLLPSETDALGAVVHDGAQDAVAGAGLHHGRGVPCSPSGKVLLRNVEAILRRHPR
eukprot:scaffold2608_cov362-Prasinococcus_capsulatus_cf.AAC.7